MSLSKKIRTSYDSKYSQIEGMQLSENRMVRYSYPRSHGTIKGKAEISNNSKHYSQIDSSVSRKCRRCNHIYSVQEDGQPIKSEICKYDGYKTAPQHVHREIDMNNLTGFVTTKDNNSVEEKKVYALDCEMVFTYGGLEVAAISMVDTDCALVYETVVIPDHPIVDYNTEFSNLCADDFRGITTTMKDMHAKILSLVGPNTILVGHGMSNDLIYLRLVHDRVVDTLELYPHRRGWPYLNSLKYLKEKFLSSSSYNVKSSGALKCREDAIATMKLVCRRLIE